VDHKPSQGKWMQNPTFVAAERNHRWMASVDGLPGSDIEIRRVGAAALFLKSPVMAHGVSARRA
jgi:hypothetical protein